jgi:NADPH:quinone reductase-like Zn-dependent oxidoreductase
VDLDQGAMSIVNPLTAMAFLELAREGQHETILQTAAASALGQMVNRLFERQGFQVINVVRREAQVELLKGEGARVILNSSDPQFDQQLKETCRQFQPRLAFDAVAGPLTMRLLEAMPRHSKVTVFGGLSYKAAEADPRQLIFQDKSIDGFWLTPWLGRKNVIQRLLIWRRAQHLITSDLKCEVRLRYPLEKVREAIEEYQRQMTGGKILLIP